METQNNPICTSVEITAEKVKLWLQQSRLAAQRGVGPTSPSSQDVQAESLKIGG